ncbi:hypothetical protein MC885_009457 [Smutsia gigantea]|nr:hypothetical protein MC885_009457 [Smutsia gigantea]
MDRSSAHGPRTQEQVLPTRAKAQEDSLSSETMPRPSSFQEDSKIKFEALAPWLLLEKNQCFGQTSVKEPNQDLACRDRIENNLSNLQEKGLSYLSQEVLYRWQIWKQSTSELTVSRDYVLNLQGVCSPYLEDVSLCGEWAGVSLQISENENYIISAINLENQDGLAWKGLTHILTPESWRKVDIMTEPQNSKGRCKSIHMGEKLYGRARYNDSLSQTSCDHEDSQEGQERNLTDTWTVGKTWFQNS